MSVRDHVFSEHDRESNEGSPGIRLAWPSVAARPLLVLDPGFEVRELLTVARGLPSSSGNTIHPQFQTFRVCFTFSVRECEERVGDHPRNRNTVDLDNDRGPRLT